MNFSQIANEDLYQMCLRGERSAWEYIYNYVLTIARSPRWRLRETPEDMAQSIVCHLLDRGIEQVHHQGAFRSFVRRLAVNLILDSFKSKEIVCLTLDATDSDEEPFCCDIPSGDPGPEETAMGSELSQIIVRSMRCLPRMCQDVLGAYVDYKMGKYGSYKALANRFGTGIGTLSSQIKRCLDKLRTLAEIKAWLGE